MKLHSLTCAKIILAWLCAGIALTAARAADTASVATTLAPDGSGRIVVEARGVPPEVPTLFSARVQQTLRVSATEITGEARVSVRIVQGKAEALSLALTGEGEVVSVTGPGLRDWSVRQAVGEAPGRRFLDLRPLLAVPVAVAGAGRGNATPATAGPRTLEWVVRMRRAEPALPGKVFVPLLAAGEAVAFESTIAIEMADTMDVKAAQTMNVSALGGERRGREPLTFVALSGEPRIEISMTRRGGALADAELTGVQLSGRVQEAVGSVAFSLRGQARVEREGARLRLLSGSAALSGAAAGDGWRVELVERGTAYDLVLERKGVVPVELAFVAALREEGDWRRMQFLLPVGAVVPLTLTGLGEGVEFDPAAVVPARAGENWQGFLPANGEVALAWKRTEAKSEAALSFASTELMDVRVGAGLLRQEAHLFFRVLQGKLGALRLRLEGPGEITRVEGPNVLGWQVVTADGARALEVRLSRPFEGQGEITVGAQQALGVFPAQVEPLRLTPEGTVRHTGFVRVANAGAVRLEVADVRGMTQLAPEQFPERPLERGVRQAFVYRFPAAEHAYRVVANQIFSDVSVNQIVTYELAETERVIAAEIELDVREAPLREWSLTVPGDYSVVAVTGADVADHAVESAGADGRRALKLFFKRELEGRTLLALRLEKNEPAARTEGTAVEWPLPMLGFPGAKAVRGHLGVVAAAGFRVTPGTAEKLVEVPLSYFPRQTTGLQQAWRLREADPAATVRVEALGQSVQADVFHLYSLREGEVQASVLINYFVVGAPASGWRIAVPGTAGNIDVTGQGVRRDWRREGDEIVVALHQPVLGASTLLVTFTEPMSARGGALAPGAVRPVGVQAERGFVQVVSALQVKHAVRRTEGALLKLEPLELPAEYRLLTTAPTLAAYQYTARPFALELGVEWYQPSETVEQVIDFAKFASQVSRDGQVVTEAQFFVKTRGSGALRLQLPAGVKLWEARVDGAVVTARTDGDVTVVPLPARANPNDPVPLTLRLGQPATGNGRDIRLLAPRLAAPLVIGEWTVRGDPERELVSRGGTAEVTQPAPTERGFEWIAQGERTKTLLLLALVAAGVLALRARSETWLPVALAAGTAALLLALWLMLLAGAPRAISRSQLDYAATAVPAEGAFAIEVGNVPIALATVSVGGLMALAAGVGCWVLAVWRRGKAWLKVPAGPLLAAGLLAQRQGAVLFFLVGAVGIFAWVLVPAIRRAWRAMRAEKAAPVAGAATTTVSLLALASVIVGAVGPAPELRAAEEVPAAQTMVQRWEIRDQRLYGEIDLTVRGAAGESFLLLQAPAVLTGFVGEGLRVGKVERDTAVDYVVTPERAGVLTARAKFELAVPVLAAGLPVLTGPATVQRITVGLDQGGWEFASPRAVQVEPVPGLGENRSGATLTLGTTGAAVINVTPRRRDAGAETVRFLAEVASVYLPAPGVVDALATVEIRPVQGRISAVEIMIPDGFTVGDVLNGPVGAWRFDPATRRLRVPVEPVQGGTFRFEVETQRATPALPFDLELQPLRVLGTAGEGGTLALALGDEAQAEAVRARDMATVSVADFDPMPLKARRNPATVQAVFRYDQRPGAVALRVAPVAPEVRVTSQQTFSLGDDRLVLAVNLRVAITRVGLFKLSFALPPGLEVESLSGPALANWTEAEENGARIVTLQLRGRTLGEQSFALSLAGPMPARTAANWRVPQVRLREATRQTGELQLVPEQGLRLRTLERSNVSELDPRTTGNVRPGVLAFRLLQADWTLNVGLEALDPWVTVQALQEVTAREGQTLTRLGVRYRIENAAVKTLRVRLPGLSAEQSRTVRATGPAVSDLVAVAGEAGLWELRFQRGIVGETPVQIEWQGAAAREQGRETVTPPTFEGARQVVQFVALRSGGRLELEAANAPRGWQRTDWTAVPVALQDRADRSVPALVFRVAEPEGPLGVAVRRHDAADALKLRVTSALLTTVLSGQGPVLTAVELQVEVVEKSTLRVRLPEGARLFNTFVNGQSVAAVREGAETLFYVAPSSATARSARVKLVYAVTSAASGRIALRGPGLNVPLENVQWRVRLPAGYELASYSGSLRREDEVTDGAYGLNEYQTFVAKNRLAEARQAAGFMAEANTLLRRGDQQQAGEVLDRVSNLAALDAATNEDARIQLRELKTTQAVLGLNTRRQRLHLENGNTAAPNTQLEKAANLNPLLKGQLNFDPQQADQLLLGNSADDTSALRGIAGRIVDQQLAAAPAPGAIDVTLPAGGRVLVFARSLQVDGAAPLELEVELKRGRESGVGFGLIVLAALGVVGLLVVRKRGEKA